MERGINVYFDENDPILAKEHKSPDEVVNAIKKGLEKSTHMIIVLSKILTDFIMKKEIRDVLTRN